MSPLRIIFMGTPDFSVATLRALHEKNHKIVAVYTRPPRRAGRGKHERPSPVDKWARRHDMQVYTPNSLRGEREQARFESFAADIAVVVAYGLILPAAVLKAPAHGCLNLHGSLLPRWRGAAPIQRAIMVAPSGTAWRTGVDCDYLSKLRRDRVVKKFIKAHKNRVVA